MKKLKFKTHIYLGFSVLIILLSASLLYGFLLLGQTIFLITAILVFMVILWILIYVTKAFERHKKIERLIRKSNADLNKLSREKEIDNWSLNGLATLDDHTRGGLSERTIAVNAIQTICQYLDAKVGVIYLKSVINDDHYIHGGSYAVTTEHIQPKITKSRGLIGESIAFKKQIVLSDIPDSYLTVTSAIGSTTPEHIIVQPFVYEDEVLGVMEIGFLHKIDHAATQFLSRAGVNLAVAIKVARSHATLAHLVEETQQQAEELEVQREELFTTNNELTHKTYLLKASEEELRVQQEELKHANAELQEKARLLAERNFSIEQARQSLAMKAKELERSGQYKNEFLANMSHELRTPLNSMLILAKLLENNKPGNLLPEQVHYATIIHRAGNDLLNLINNILDLAKIESGSVELVIERIEYSDITQDLLELFGSIADSKAIDFHITINEGLPLFITTDGQRLKQILKNLLANAFKFTGENGRIELSFAMASQSSAWKTGMLNGIAANQALALSVTDTGIGIAADKQQLIFEAFKQADGSTSRKFGGTGLGLSICRELATVLGGEIHVASEEDKGSTFTLFIPLRYAGSSTQPAVETEKSESEKGESPPSLGHVKFDKKPKRLLIIEDDQNFAKILELYAREHGFEPFVAHQGHTGLRLAFDLSPDAIILDMLLPVMDGWTVLQKLKNNPDTMNIPVHLMSADRTGKQNIEEKAVGFLKKPADNQSLDDVFDILHNAITPSLKTALLIEDNRAENDRLKSTLAENGVDTPQRDKVLQGKRIFLADDDMRNIFALSSVFSSYGIRVETANNGLEALDVIQKQPDIDLVLMDIMMPELDGYETIRKIRAIKRFAKLPIIVMTAKAIQGDKQHALDVGANDYITKPIAVDKLLSLMRVWLS